MADSHPLYFHVKKRSKPRAVMIHHPDGGDQKNKSFNSALYFIFVKVTPFACVLLL